MDALMFLVDNMHVADMGTKKNKPREKDKSSEGEFEQMLSTLMENENSDTKNKVKNEDADTKMQPKNENNNENVDKNNVSKSKEKALNEVQLKPQKTQLFDELAKPGAKHEEIKSGNEKQMIHSDVKNNKNKAIHKNLNKHTAYMQQKKQKTSIAKETFNANAEAEGKTQKNSQPKEVANQERNIKFNSLRQIVPIAENNRSPDSKKLKAIQSHSSQDENVDKSEKNRGNSIKRIDFQEFLKNKNENREVKTNVQNNFSHREIISNSNSEVSKTNVPKFTPSWNIADQIVQNTRTFASEGRTFMEIQLKPEFLGKVRVNLSYHEGIVTASLTAEKGQTGQLLNSAMHQIRAIMQEQGIKVDYLGVNVGEQYDGQNNEGTNSHNGKQNQKLLWHREGIVGEIPINEEELGLQRYYSSEVNYLA